MSQEHVSVVIPSAGREDVLRAVRSAKEQQGVEVQVVVAYNGPQQWTWREAVTAEADVVLELPERSGAPRSRNAGVAAATAPWVAFLDDDDVFLPHKLQVQLAAAAQQPAGVRPVIAGRVELRADGDAGAIVVPEHGIGAQERPEDYLFRGRGLSPSRNALFTSVLVLPTELAREVPWDESLRRHQDWDFVVRLSRRPDVRFVVVDDVVGVQALGSAGSISAGSDWKSSLAWFAKASDDWDRRTCSDFLVGQSLRHALSARSAEGVRAVLTALRGHGSPSPSTMALGLAGAVPRGWLERAALLRSR